MERGCAHGQAGDGVGGCATTAESRPVAETAGPSLPRGTTGVAAPSQDTRAHAPGAEPRPRRQPAGPDWSARPRGPACRTAARFPGLRTAVASDASPQACARPRTEPPRDGAARGAGTGREAAPPFLPRPRLAPVTSTTWPRPPPAGRAVAQGATKACTVTCKTAAMHRRTAWPPAAPRGISAFNRRHELNLVPKFTTNRRPRTNRSAEAAWRAGARGRGKRRALR